MGNKNIYNIYFNDGNVTTVNTDRKLTKELSRSKYDGRKVKYINLVHDGREERVYQILDYKTDGKTVKISYLHIDYIGCSTIRSVTTTDASGTTWKRYYKVIGNLAVILPIPQPESCFDNMSLAKLIMDGYMYPSYVHLKFVRMTDRKKYDSVLAKKRQMSRRANRKHNKANENIELARFNKDEKKLRLNAILDIVKSNDSRVLLTVDDFEMLAKHARVKIDSETKKKIRDNIRRISSDGLYCDCVSAEPIHHIFPLIMDVFNRIRK